MQVELEPPPMQTRSSLSGSSAKSYRDEVWEPGTITNVSELAVSIERLNQETFPAAIFAMADDLIVDMMMAKKRQLSGYKALIPNQVVLRPEDMPSRPDAILAASIYDEVMTQGPFSMENVKTLVERLQRRLPHVFPSTGIFTRCARK